MSYQIVWNELPKNLEELQALPQADLKTPEGTAALTVAALAVYPTDHGLHILPHPSRQGAR